MKKLFLFFLEACLGPIIGAAFIQACRYFGFNPDHLLAGFFIFMTKEYLFFLGFLAILSFLILEPLRFRQRLEGRLARRSANRMSAAAPSAPEPQQDPVDDRGLDDVLWLLERAKELYSRYLETRRTTLTVHDSIVWENELEARLPFEKKTHFQLLTHRLRHEYEPDNIEDVKLWVGALVTIAREMEGRGARDGSRA